MAFEHATPRYTIRLWRGQSQPHRAEAVNSSRRCIAESHSAVPSLPRRTTSSFVPLLCVLSVCVAIHVNLRVEPQHAELAHFYALCSCAREKHSDVNRCSKKQAGLVCSWLLSIPLRGISGISACAVPACRKVLENIVVGKTSTRALEHVWRAQRIGSGPFTNSVTRVTRTPTHAKHTV